MESTLLRFTEIADKYYLVSISYRNLFTKKLRGDQNVENGWYTRMNILVENTHIPLETTCSSKHMCTYTECAAALYTNKVHR